jgi:hypothetical protein
LINEQEQAGRFFRSAWITGVTTHYQGTPRSGYVAPWEEMQVWEQQSAIAVYEQVRQFVQVTDGQARQLSRAQKGRFVCLCWIGQIFKHFSQPKESYIADWEQIPVWQQETDADIFEAIAAEV